MHSRLPVFLAEVRRGTSVHVVTRKFRKALDSFLYFNFTLFSVYAAAVPFRSFLWRRLQWFPLRAQRL
jgi:hypothetical protein